MTITLESNPISALRDSRTTVSIVPVVARCGVILTSNVVAFVVMLLRLNPVVNCYRSMTIRAAKPAVAAVNKVAAHHAPARFTTRTKRITGSSKRTITQFQNNVTTLFNVFLADVTIFTRNNQLVRVSKSNTVIGAIAEDWCNRRSCC
jgi:hypothetical protein